MDRGKILIILSIVEFALNCSVLGNVQAAVVTERDILTDVQKIKTMNSNIASAYCEMLDAGFKAAKGKFDDEHLMEIMQRIVFDYALSEDEVAEIADATDMIVLAEQRDQVPNGTYAKMTIKACKKVGILE